MVLVHLQMSEIIQKPGAHKVSLTYSLLNLLLMFVVKDIRSEAGT